LTENKAYLAALRILARCDRSAADLGNRLRRSNYPNEQIEDALSRCRKLGYLDDRRLADNLARSMTESGRAVGRKLLFELKKKGIPTELAEAAVAAAGDSVDAGQQLLATLRRRFPDFDPRAPDPPQRRRVLGFFQRRGYRLDEIFAAFDALAELTTAEHD